MKARNGASGPSPRVRAKPHRPARGVTIETFSSFVRNLARLEDERTVDAKRGGRDGAR
jgi:hypothetical protein